MSTFSTKLVASAAMVMLASFATNAAAQFGAVAPADAARDANGNILIGVSTDGTIPPGAVEINGLPQGAVPIVGGQPQFGQQQFGQSQFNPQLNSYPGVAPAQPLNVPGYQTSAGYGGFYYGNGGQATTPYGGQYVTEQNLYGNFPQAGVVTGQGGWRAVPVHGYREAIAVRAVPIVQPAPSPAPVPAPAPVAAPIKVQPPAIVSPKPAPVVEPVPAPAPAAPQPIHIVNNNYNTIRVDTNATSRSTATARATATAKNYPMQGQAIAPLNLRACPSTKCRRIATIPTGRKLTLTGCRTNWCSAVVGRQKCWVSRKFVGVKRW